jgi:hypothetical protein
VADGTACELDGLAEVCIDGVCGGFRPQIMLVEWKPSESCSPGSSASDYTVTVSATDPDSDPMTFTYEGSVSGCLGQIDAMVSTITCPNSAAWPGSVMVFDGDGNVSDPVNFQMGLCKSGSVTP